MLELTPSYAQARQGNITIFDPQLLQTYESLTKPSLLMAFNGYARMTPTSTFINRVKMTTTSSITCI